MAYTPYTAKQRYRLRVVYPKIASKLHEIEKILKRLGVEKITATENLYKGQNLMVQVHHSIMQSLIKRE